MRRNHKRPQLWLRAIPLNRKHARQQPGCERGVGLFTFSYDAAYSDREIDIELSRWDYAYGASDVEDYAVQPYYDAGQVLHFPLPVGVTNSTHSFIWQSTNIAFQSLNGDFASPPVATNILESWNLPVGDEAGGEQVHLNLWLDNGNPPANNQPVEVVISHFEFVPLGSPQPAQLSQLIVLPGGNVLFSVQGQTDWHYDILASSDLLYWQDIGTILATNNLFQFTDTNPVSFISPLLPHSDRTVRDGSSNPKTIGADICDSFVGFDSFKGVSENCKKLGKIVTGLEQIFLEYPNEIAYFKASESDLIEQIRQLAPFLFRVNCI